MIKSDENFVMLPVPVSMFAAVCAVLGGASTLAIAAAAPAPSVKPADKPQPEAAPAEPAGDAAEAAPADGAIDAAGWPWTPELHASTKGTTKDGLWRMKVGVSRPEPKPGFPKDGASANGPASPASPSAEAGAAAASTGAPSGEDEDEFAAFRAAAENSNATDAAAAGAVTARKWTDADLGALCNQAAVKLGDPAPVKALIAGAVPAGAVPHSRNIPDDQREAFAQSVEKAAGIEFAG